MKFHPSNPRSKNWDESFTLQRFGVNIYIFFYVFQVHYDSSLGDRMKDGDYERIFVEAGAYSISILESIDTTILARAKNGTGKTGAHSIPILESIDTSKALAKGMKIFVKTLTDMLYTQLHTYITP